MTDRLYARISLDTAASGSIAKQRLILSKHAAPGAVEYVDESVSGSKVAFADRPAGGRLMADLQPGDRILATRIDRIARSVRDLLDLVERIDAAGASLRFTEQDVNTEGPMGKFLLTLLGAVAELEAGMIAERRREALKAFAAEGRHATGKAPFGLHSVPNPNGRGLVLRPDPETAPVLREAVKRLLNGATQAEVARNLGLLETNLSRLLRNERLAGVLNPGDPEPRIDPEQAVFTLPEWQKIQDHIDRPEKAWTKAEGIGPALRCAVCGDRLYLGKAANRAYDSYKCRGVKHEPGSGGRVSIMKHLADNYIAREFIARFGDEPETRIEIAESNTAKVQAIAEARLRVEVARRALEDADEDDDAAEEAAFTALKKAKKDLKAAKDLPTSRVSVVKATGRTMAEAYAAAPDDDARAAVLAHFGPWFVVPGRISVDRKIRHADERSGSQALANVQPADLHPGWAVMHDAAAIVDEAAARLAEEDDATA